MYSGHKIQRGIPSHFRQELMTEVLNFVAIHDSIQFWSIGCDLLGAEYDLVRAIPKAVFRVVRSLAFLKGSPTLISSCGTATHFTPGMWVYECFMMIVETSSQLLLIHVDHVDV